MSMWKAAVLSTIVLCAGGCREAERSRVSSNSRESDLVFLTRDGCANTTIMRENLDAALRAMGRSAGYTVIDLDKAAAGDVRGGFGTPTVLYQGRDLFGMSIPAQANPGAT